jgi:leader peptidase (prepilin peptidase)/N-methyltransferase
MWVHAVAGLVLGAIVGSFLATILIRWPQERSALRGRSQCDGCGETLSAGELVPVLSFVLARGHCRRCGAAIDPRHLAIELGAAFIGFVALAAHPGVLGAITAVFGWWLLLLAALDVEHHWLPDRLSVPLAPAGILVGLAGYGPPLDERLIGVALGFLVLTAIAFAYRRIRGREGLGGGDPKLLAALGAWLGWQQLPLVLLGAGMIGLAAILMIGLRGRKVEATDRLPLGALMALAAWPIWLLTAA